MCKALVAGGPCAGAACTCTKFLTSAFSIHHVIGLVVAFAPDMRHRQRVARRQGILRGFASFKSSAFQPCLLLLSSQADLLSRLPYTRL